MCRFEPLRQPCRDAVFQSRILIRYAQAQHLCYVLSPILIQLRLVLQELVAIYAYVIVRRNRCTELASCKSKGGQRET